MAVAQQAWLPVCGVSLLPLQGAVVEPAVEGPAEAAGVRVAEQPGHLRHADGRVIEVVTRHFLAGFIQQALEGCAFLFEPALQPLLISATSVILNKSSAVIARVHNPRISASALPARWRLPYGACSRSPTDMCLEPRQSIALIDYVGGHPDSIQ